MKFEMFVNQKLTILIVNGLLHMLHDQIVDILMRLLVILSNLQIKRKFEAFYGQEVIFIS